MEIASEIEGLDPSSCRHSLPLRHTYTRQIYSTRRVTVCRQVNYGTSVYSQSWRSTQPSIFPGSGVVEEEPEEHRSVKDIY